MVKISTNINKTNKHLSPPPLRPFPKKLEIAKQSSSTCNISIFYPLTFNTDERRVGITLIDLAPPYLYGCPNLVPGFPTTYGIIVFSELR
jgi:hypothetical protein